MIILTPMLGPAAYGTLEMCHKARIHELSERVTALQELLDQMRETPPSWGDFGSMTFVGEKLDEALAHYGRIPM